MTPFRKWTFAALAALTLAAPLLTARPAWAQPRTPTIPNQSPVGGPYWYNILAREGADRPWADMGNETTPAAAQADADNLRRLGYEVVIRKVAQPAAAAVSLARGWSSDYGPVTFEIAGGADRGVASLTGSWRQGENMVGRITGGTFDPRTRSLVFIYYQDWNDQHGRAEMTLSEDGQTLTGSWTQESGSGGWTLTRTK